MDREQHNRAIVALVDGLLAQAGFQPDCSIRNHLGLLHLDENAAIARLRQRHAEACEIAAQPRAERDAALAKIGAHNAAMDETCQWCKGHCDRTGEQCAFCPRHHRIEVDG